MTTTFYKSAQTQKNVLREVVFELCVVEFCSEILLLIPKFNQTCAVHSFNFVWFQTKLHSTQFNYLYKYSYTFKCSITNCIVWLQKNRFKFFFFLKEVFIQL